MPRSRRTVAWTCSARRRTSAAVPCLVVDDEVGVLLAHRRATDAPALQAQLIDDPAGRFAARVAKDAARGRQAQRLMLLAPAADLVEPLADQARGRPARARTSPR